jgi:hypothetical protein
MTKIKVVQNTGWTHHQGTDRLITVTARRADGTLMNLVGVSALYEQGSNARGPAALRLIDADFDWSLRAESKVRLKISDTHSMQLTPGRNYERCILTDASGNQGMLWEGYGDVLPGFTA